MEKRLSTRRREGGDQSLLSRYCRRSQLTQGFLFIFGRHFPLAHQSEVCCSLFSPKVMRMIYYLIQVLRRKKKMLNLCTIQIQWLWRHLAFKFIRYDHESSSPSSLIIMIYDDHHSSGMVLDSRGWASTKAGRLFLLIMYFFSSDSSFWCHSCLLSIQQLPLFRFGHFSLYT